MEEHIKHVQIVFERFKNFGIVINPVKVGVIFLAHFINSAGVSLFPSKVEAFANFPAPDTMRNLRQLW